MGMTSMTSIRNSVTSTKVKRWSWCIGMSIIVSVVVFLHQRAASFGFSHTTFRFPGTAMMGDANMSQTVGVGGSRHLPDTCRCRSMFTVGACGLEEVAQMKGRDVGWVSAIRGLDEARRTLEVRMMPHLATLARYLPQVLKVNVSYGSVGQVQIRADPKASRAATTLPFLPCKIHLYSPSEVLACTRHYQTSRGGPLRIAFVGDSRVRNMMQQMIRATLPDLQYRLKGETQLLNLTLGFLESKAKYNVPVVGDGVELRLYWSTFLEMPRQADDISKQGARDLLEAWASGTPNPDDGPVPDIIYATSGLWDTSMSTEDVAVSDFLNTMRVMSPILETLSHRTRVLWHIHGPIKPWLAIRDVPNGALDMINRASWARLRGGKVWLWDTHTIMMLRQHTECLALHLAGLKDVVPHSWGCKDFQHAGRDVEDAAANMVWNLACNSVLGLEGDLCCTQ